MRKEDLYTPAPLSGGAGNNKKEIAMNEYDLYQSNLRKLKDFCDDNGLDCAVFITSYPLTMEVTVQVGLQKLPHSAIISGMK